MVFSFKVSFLFLCTFAHLSAIESAKILGLFPTHSKSHLIIHSTIAEALAERGHNVTVVSTHEPIKKNLPYRYIHLNIPPFASGLFSKTVKHQFPSIRAMIGFTGFMKILSEYSNASLHHPLMQKLMDEESFDLVIHGYLMNDFLFGVAAHFKCPIVISYTTRLTSNLNDLVGNPQEFVYVPHSLLSATKPNGFFFDRVRDFLLAAVADEMIFRAYLHWEQELFYKSNFPLDKYPSLDVMKKNVSMVLVAHHFSQYPIRPDVPAVVEIGGIHIKDKPDPLPEDIQSLLDNATQNGAIYFSLGTNIQQNHLEASKVNLLFKVLSKLPQTVLCKWSASEIPVESPNLFYRKWLPQEDVLHHSNVKLFITHGGLGGIAEAEYHGVPMVGIPLINDQKPNMENVQNSGYGLKVDYATLSEEGLHNAIKEVLSNKSYAENVKRFSRIYKDRPLSAKETAVYWVEYVLRHHGAPHLQSRAVHMNYFQLLMLDVFGFLIIIAYIVFKVMKMIILSLRRMCCNIKFKEE